MAAAMATEFRRGVSWALLSAFLYAVFTIPWKLSSERGDAAVSVLALVVSAAVFNALASLVQRRPQGLASSAGAQLTPTGRLLLALALAAMTLLGNMFGSMSVALVSAPVLSVLQRTEVLWVGLLAALFLGEVLEGRFFFGVLMSAAGLTVLQLGGGAGQVQVSLSGTLYGLLSAVAFAVMAVLTRKYITRINPVRLNALRLWLALLIWLPLYGTRLRGDFDTLQLAYGAVAGVIGPGLSRICLMLSLRHVEARVAAMVVQVAPVMTVLVAFVAFHELPSTHDLLGGLLMVCGVLVSVLPVEMLRTLLSRRH